jgi:hypothetical protein
LTEQKATSFEGQDKRGRQEATAPKKQERQKVRAVEIIIERRIWNNKAMEGREEVSVAVV